MPGSNPASFIPKHNTQRPERSKPARQVFVGTLVVRIIFFATILSTAVTFFYNQRIISQYSSEIEKFKTAVATFEADSLKLNEIVSFSNRLKLASRLRAETVSTNAVFTAMEKAVIGPVQFTSVGIERKTPDEIILTAGLNADTFNSVIFQRDVLGRNDVLGSAVFEDVKIDFIGTQTTEMALPLTQSAITFTAVVSLSPATIPVLNEASGGIIPISQINAPQPVPDSNVSVSGGSEQI